MNRFIIGALLIILGISQANAQEKWSALFNGKNLKGWEHVGPGEMVIEEGIMKTVGGMGLLWYTKKKLGNCVIKVVYKGADVSNAGLHIRIPEKPTNPWTAVHKGYEIQIDDTEDDFHVTGVIYSMTEAKARPGKPGWNTMMVTLDGNKTIVHVNDVLVTEFTEGDEVPPQKETWEPKRGPRPEYGYIGIQNHGNDDTVYFKEISMRPLNDKKGAL